ncbi:MAG: hypothetical protein ACREPM_16305, partial [Gemmatimonadaceae bacterium]
MGGIADYSGALVLQLPLGRVTSVSVQRQPARRIDVTSRRGGEWVEFSMDLDDIAAGWLRDPAELARWFAKHHADRWAASPPPSY